MTSSELCDRLVLLLVGGMSATTAEAWCASQPGSNPGQASELVKAARTRITVAADYSRDEQIGLAVLRFDSLYSKAASAGDLKTALQAQRELGNLLCLKTPSAGRSPQTAEHEHVAASLEIVKSHLLPLRLVNESFPIEEHARLAAQFIRERRN